MFGAAKGAFLGSYWFFFLSCVWPVLGCLLFAFIVLLFFGGFLCLFCVFFLCLFCVVLCFLSFNTLYIVVLWRFCSMLFVFRGLVVCCVGLSLIVVVLFLGDFVWAFRLFGWLCWRDHC